MTRDQYRIRPARADDVPALARLMAMSYRHAFADILPPHVLDTRNETFFGQRFSEQWSSVTMAEMLDQTCAGLIQVRTGHLDLIFVDPGCEGSGLAQMLLRQAETLGARTLECFRDNSRARRFYEKQGWHLAGAYEREFAEAIYPFVTYAKMPAPNP